LTELDLSDEHDSKQVRLLVYQTVEPDLYVYEGEDTGVVVDFDKSVVRLSKVRFFLFHFLFVRKFIR